MNQQTKNTWIFIGFLLLAGLANLTGRYLPQAGNALMNCVHSTIYIGLLVFWIQSVRIRLVPSGAKTCIVSAGLFMLLYMLLRIFKYSLAVDITASRYAVYAYWIPQLFIPTLFLITCIRISRNDRDDRKRIEALLLILATGLVLLVLTNDLHSLVYVPRIDLSQFAVDTGTYVYRSGFYLLYVWMILTSVLGLRLLFQETSRSQKRAAQFLLRVILLWIGLALLNFLFFYRNRYDIHVFNLPETQTFGMLAVFEICIRYRLIPHNENYIGFFHSLHMPVLITDRQFRTVYRSGVAMTEEPDRLKAALEASVTLLRDQKLHGQEIRAGYAFWIEDESRIHRVQERLLEANALIEQENDLIRAETEQKEQDAYLESRHRIYYEIAGELYPCQKRIGQILEKTVPGSAGFRENIALVCVLNAYVKRKTNLLLLSAENETLEAQELFLALQESANYLTLAGLPTTAAEPEENRYPAEDLLALYDAFETIAEQLLGKVPSLMVSWKEGGLRLAAEMEGFPDTDEISLPVKFYQSEEILYMEIPAGKGGEGAWG